MNVVPLTPELFPLWNEFVSQSDDAWFWHTTEWLEYTLCYRLEIQPKSFSFFVMQDKKVVAICPLIAEQYGDHAEFSFGQEFGPPPAFSKDLNPKEKENTMKLVFDTIDILARENKIAVARFRCSVLNESFLNPTTWRYNFLHKFGFTEASMQTQIVDVSRSLEDIRREVRHGHDADIKKASRYCQVNIFDKDTLTEEVFGGYRTLHALANGKVTRPLATFEKMYQFIKEGNGFLAEAKVEGKPVAYAYFFAFKNNVYYGSSCIDPNATNVGASHLIQWQAIEYMHTHGFHFYEIGWQQFPTFFDFPSPKQEAISRFKRGFGGVTVPLFRGEKYYDAEYFLKVYQKRCQEYAHMISHLSLTSQV